MANRMVVEFAAFLMAAVVVTFVVAMYRRRRTSQPEFPVNAPVRPLAERPKLVEAKNIHPAHSREVQPPLVVKTISSNTASEIAMRSSASSEAPKPPAILDMRGL